jgi:hypothetical protein
MQWAAAGGGGVLNTSADPPPHRRLARHASPGEALVHGFATASGWAALSLACAALAVLGVVRTPRPHR